MQKISSYSPIKKNYLSKNSTTNRKITFCNANTFATKHNPPKNKLLKFSAITGIALLVMGALGKKHISKLEQKNIFAPNRRVFKPIPKNLENVIKTITTKTKDGLSLEHYYIPAQEGKKTVIFCHGVINNATKFFNVAEFLHQKGYGILLLEYRGFGKNPGITSEKGFAKDLDSAVDYLKQQGISQEKITLWGFSMGGGVATEAAKSNKFSGLILSSPFTDMKSIVKYELNKKPPIKNALVQNILKSIPAKMLPLGNKFENQSKIASIRTKTLILHAKDDNVIPFEMAKKLAEKAQNAQLYISQTGGHEPLGLSEKTILEFLNSLQ